MNASQKAALYEVGLRYLLECLQSEPQAYNRPQQLRQWAQQYIGGTKMLAPQAEKDSFCEDLVHAITGFGPLECFLQDEEVSEIMVNGPAAVWVERHGKLEQTAVRFHSVDQLQEIINRMVAPVGRRIDQSQPLVDARLPDGSRINAIIEPLSLQGPLLTIRKFPQTPFSIDQMLAHGSLSPPMAELLTLLVHSQQNLLIVGGTGAGKTSTLNACASLIPEHERLITIEDSAELRINHPHRLSLESRPPSLEGQGEITIRALLKNALRMRPDRIVVGEIRGGEALDMLQAMNTGHEGSLTTVHANSPLESLYRLETMALMSEVALPLEAIRPQIAQGIHWIIQQARLSDGSRKLVDIAQVQGFAEQKYQVRSVVKLSDKAEFETQGWTPDLVAKRGSNALAHWCAK
jgi:pilus assembly protein CpaF